MTAAGSSDDDGTVTREVALTLLAHEGVVVTKNGENIGLAKDEIADVLPLPGRLKRNMVHHLARRFSVPIHKFYAAEVVAVTVAAEKVS